MGRDAKKYNYPPCAYIKFVQNYLTVLPATGNSHWFNSDVTCYQMSITPYQKDIDAVSVSQ